MTQPPAGNHTVFVGASAQPGQPPVAQTDRFSVNANYPTSWWKPGFVFVDEHVFRVGQPRSGPLLIVAGLYSPQRGARLEASDASGARLASDAVVIGFVPWDLRATMRPGLLD